MNPLRRHHCKIEEISGCSGLFLCRYRHAHGNEVQWYAKKRQFSEQQYGMVACPAEWEITAVKENEHAE